MASYCVSGEDKSISGQRESKAAYKEPEHEATFQLISTEYGYFFLLIIAGMGIDENKDTMENSTVSSNKSKLRGCPINVVVATENHTFELKEEALERILLDPEVRDKKVVVVSVAGAFRKGKSFLLDFFLRYLSAEKKSEWLGDESSPLKGFPWRGGAERETTGIWMWSEPFHVKIPSTGEDVVILLMDTQGVFDSQSTVKDCATIFALSTLLSSVQVYNLSSNIQRNDLQNLQMFTDYGCIALEENNNNGKPFQALHFLVRDWVWPYEYDYGATGGQSFLDKRLQIVEGQHKELQSICTHIRSCFSQVGCFLMPHPGLGVATNPRFDGKLREVEADFLTQLSDFVPSLLAAENLVLKEINGYELTGKDLVEYFKSCMRIFQSDNIPSPKSIMEATAETNNLVALASAKELYEKEMEEVRKH